VVGPRRHDCLLSISEEQRAEVAAAYPRPGERVLFLGADPEWYLRRLREDGREIHPDILSGPPSCGALATLLAGERILCVYDNATVRSGQRRKILVSHKVIAAPALFDDGLLRITSQDEGLRLAGELDISNRAALRTALRTDPAVVDVSALRFVDAGGIVAMHSAARGRLRLLHPQPMPKRVIALVDPLATRLVCEDAR
jgi:hypothetical protein